MLSLKVFFHASESVARNLLQIDFHQVVARRLIDVFGRLHRFVAFFAKDEKIGRLTFGIENPIFRNFVLLVKLEFFIAIDSWRTWRDYLYRKFWRAVQRPFDFLSFFGSDVKEVPVVK